MAQEVKRAVCEMCHSRCRVSVYSDNGRLVKIEEDPSDIRRDGIFPPTRACLRLRGSMEMLYHPDRVNFPRKRVGERGEGKWQTIPWGQAFDEIAERLRGIKERYGAEALALTRGTGRTHMHYFGRFMSLFGSPNYMGQSTICYGPNCVVPAAIYGFPVRSRLPVGAAAFGREEAGGGISSKSLLIIGTVASQSILRLWKSLRDAKESGSKIIIVDPRRTQDAELADLWLQLRPGTDTALMMSMINVIIEERLYDKDFVEKWCYGFDKLTERARDYPPEKVAEITRVPAEKIREAARMYATNKPAFTLHGMGMEHLQDCIEAIQASYILVAITGNLDVAGGNYMPGPPEIIGEPEINLYEMLSPEQKSKQLGADRFKLMSCPGYDLISENVKRLWGKTFCHAISLAAANAPTVYRAMLTDKPYPVRAAITAWSNPMITQANVKLVYKALKSLDFYVVLDWWMTPSAEIADYVLPPASWLERPFMYSVSGSDNSILCGEQALPSAIPGEYDHRTDYEILRELGIRLGQEEFWPWKTLEEAYDYQLSPLGISLKELMAKGGLYSPPTEYKKYEKMGGFATPTGKVELYSTIFEKLGYDPLPRYEEPAETPISEPELAKEYPLMLITGGRFLWMYHSEHRQVDSVRKRHPHPLVQINPETASKLEIKNGDWVWIESPRGRIRMKCQYFEGIDPTVVHCEHGWWFPELPGEEPWLHGVWESNVNVLTNDDPDVCNKLHGGWPLKTALCKIYKCKTY